MAQEPDRFQERARALYQQALVWDDHSGFDPDARVDLACLDQWKRAGVHYLSVNVGYDVVPWRKTLQTLAAFRAWVQQHPGDYLLVERADDVLRARREGRMAISFDLEGMNALDGDVHMVSAYHALGVRQMLFAYNRNNLAGGGCHDTDPGLTAFGRSVITEMNRVGMLVDCSHTGLRTSMEAMEASTAPVIFSHSCAHAVTPHGRNITDAQIRACAATGGVVGINGVGLFLGGNDRCTERFADHVVHASNVAGPDHVGIALDYSFDTGGIETVLDAHADYWPRQEYPGGSVHFMPPEELPQIVEILLRRGFSDSAITGLLGGNFLRVAQQVWK
ncbi:MAG: membrane dipeptidase [Rhodoferax sp.]|nr:membrane dipeptidase [Rhodoferax sp.]